MGLTVSAYGESFDAITIQQFSSASAAIKPENPHHYNSSIFITDQELSCIHYPSRQDFAKHHVTYMPLEKFLSLQKTIKRTIVIRI